MVDQSIATHEAGKSLSGFGGWLLPPAFGTLIAPFIILVGLYQNASMLPQLTSNTTVYSLAALEVALQAAFLAASLYMIHIMLKRRRSYPNSFITFQLALIAFIVVDLLTVAILLNAAPRLEDTKDLMQAVTGAAIWIPYMLRSKRVANTFVN